jgi:hypothetical protein
MANINETPKAELAKMEVAEEAARPVTNDERRAMTEAQRKYFEALEARRNGGGNVLVKKQTLLDTSELSAKNPDIHYRWANTSNREKMEQRVNEGYVTVPEEEGGRRLGEMVLMAIPREVADARKAEYQRMTRERLGQFRKDMREAAAEMAYEAKKRGLRIPDGGFLITE